MPLDLSALGKQVRAMSGSLAGEVSAKSQRQQLALGRYLESSEAHSLWAQAVNLSRESASWLFALPTEPLDTVVDLPAQISAYALVASDGSQVDVERHGIAMCYVINIGRVFIRYGHRPLARLNSQPTLYFRDEDLYLYDGVRPIAIEGNYLSARRDVEEGLALVGLADEFLADDLPNMALQDGTLVRWSLANAERVVQDYFLTPYLGYLDAMRERGIPVASYISRPRSPEVAGTIRLMFCPDVDVAQGKGAVCGSCSAVAAGKEPPCSVCNGLSDAEILADGLQEGQRGAIFVSMSRINIECYGEHLIHFFYLRFGREIARVEIPRWVAIDRTMVDRVHSLIYDQCVRGQGYPVALARAHEQAVVRSADRRAFLGVVEGSLRRAELPASGSRKAESKQGVRG
ncbi:MAG: DNA double-strand break repair nuclease NurA [Roseiflexaceae bacterium]|nr:DNA double-strand break repair nuclease NurA [Roseiflexaceae bacterium]